MQAYATAMALFVVNSVCAGAQLAKFGIFGAVVAVERSFFDKTG